MKFNILVVIIAIDFDDGERLEYKNTAIGSIMRYYHHYGIRVKVIEQRPSIIPKDKHPIYTRLYVHDIFQGEEFILTHGLDMLPCHYRYNIQDFLRENFINLAVDCSVEGYSPKLSNHPQNPHFRYNTELMGMPRRYIDMYHEIGTQSIENKSNYEGYEQYYINERLFTDQIYVNEIPIIFNRFWHEGFNYTENAFCHYTHGCPNPEKYDYIKKYHPREML